MVHNLLDRHAVHQKTMQECEALLTKWKVPYDIVQRDCLPEKVRSMSKIWPQSQGFAAWVGVCHDACKAYKVRVVYSVASQQGSLSAERVIHKTTRGVELRAEPVASFVVFSKRRETGVEV